MDNKTFIEQVYEIAFGNDAINRNFNHFEVIEALEEMNKDSVKWDQISDYDKDFYEQEWKGSDTD